MKFPGNSRHVDMRFPGKFPGSAPGSVWEAASRRRLGARFPGRCPASHQRLSASREIPRDIGDARRGKSPVLVFFYSVSCVFLPWAGPILGQDLKFSFLGGADFLRAFLVRCASRVRLGCVCAFLKTHHQTHQIFYHGLVKFWIKI